jgi:glycosyltransferase involved in cell wall biosynthesis
MRVAFNARLLYAPSLRGWNRYTINLLTELPALGVELYLYSDRPLHEAHLARLPADGHRVSVAPAMRYASWEQLWLPRQCEKDRVDILHCPFNFGLPWSSPCPRVLTLHDAIGQVYHAARGSWRDRLKPAALLTRLYHWIARSRATRIITVSEHARRDLVKCLGLPVSRISVVYEAADPHFHTPASPEVRADVRRRYGLGRPYVLYVGGWEDRKNVPFLVRGFAAAALADADLVLAGGRDDERAGLQALAADLRIADRVRLLGWVPEEDLPALYAEALCFVYPSAYEGFGLQLCEAMAAGCPVLAARATCLPEVLGDGGELFGLDDTADLAGLLRLVAQRPDYRADLAERGRARGRHFSWAKAAAETADLYRALCSPSHPGRAAAVS